jgi:ribonuclease P protein component
MNTLKNTREFQMVVEHGDRKTLRTITVYMLPTRSEETRIGISISKRIGNSVKRNKLRRRMREVIRENAPLLPAGTDIVIVARRGPSEASFQEIEEDIKQLRCDE